MSEQIFKRVSKTIELRRNILESSKVIIENLKSYQKIVDLREKKAEYLNALKIQIKEINVMMDSLKDNFPTELQKKYYDKNKSKIEKITKEKKTISKKVAESSELAKLESKLSDIESKLKSLS